MAQSTTELLFGGPYTQRGSFGFGMLMFIIGGALLLWISTIEVSSIAPISGFLVVLGSILLMAGPVGDRINNQFFSKYWRLVTGAGSMIVGIACLLFPVFRPTGFLIVVGLGSGLPLVGQGILTVRDHTQLE